MADNKKTPRNDFSLEEILAEAHTLKKDAKPEALKAETAKPSESKTLTGRQKSAVSPEGIAEQALRALDAKTSVAFQPSAVPDVTEKGRNGKKKGLFKRRRREIPEFDEEDIYYGLQLKSLKDYREDYEKTVYSDAGKNKKAENESNFSYLFQETDDSSLDDEIAERFESLHSERQSRLEKVLERAGLEHDDIFSFYENGRTAAQKEPPVTQPGPKQPEAHAAEKSGPLQPQEEPVTEPGQPAVIPSPKPAPVSTPAPRPEILPGPLHEPEIREPSTEPAFQPSRTPPSQPHSVPGIMCLDSEEPVKEPVFTPEMKEELPHASPMKEPPARPAPRAGAEPNYRPTPGRPMHLVDLSDLKLVLSAEAANYLPAEPQPPPPPIPLIKPMTEKPEPETENYGSSEYKPPIIIEQTAEFEPIRAPFEEPLEETEPAEQTGEPILFPAPAGHEDPEARDPEEESAEDQGKKKSFSIFGNEEDENDIKDNLPNEQDELDDYSIPADAPSIAYEIGSNLRKLYLRLAVTGISCVLLFLNGFLGEMAGVIPQDFQISLGIQPYLIINLVFLVIPVIFCIPAIFNGIKSLFIFQANSDSAVAIASVATIIQGVALLFSQESVKNGSLHLYSTLVVAALFLNTAGKVNMINRISKNFRFVAAPDQKQAVQLFDDHNTALQMAKGCVIDAPVIAFQTKTNFLKHFLRLSYETDPSDQSSQTLAPIGFVCSLILCIVTLVLSKNMFYALSAFAAATCISVPMVNMLSVNLLLNRLAKIASRCGAMIVGYPAVEQFSNTNAVMVDAKELFPKGTVILNGIKTFGGQRIDDAIVDATALMCAVGGPLSDLFDQIIKSRRDMLPKIDNPVYEDNKGVTGWVSGRRILVGNRELMESHDIEPPSRDYEEKYISGGKKVVYLASGGDLVALFIVSYDSDRRRAMELRRMEDNGISLIVRTCDPNITPHLLAECFGLDEHCINVLPERLGKVFTEITALPQERSPALMATKGRPTAMMRMLTACVRMRNNISIAVALQNVSVILGFALVAFLTCYSGLQHLSTSALLTYEIFWAAAILLVPRLRKP
jgi:hypothetical protein